MSRQDQRVYSIAEKRQPGSIARIGPHGRNLVILNFVRAHLVFVGQPAKTHLQNRVRAVVREATTSVGLFSKV
jgi:hypothetical protein